MSGFDRRTFLASLGAGVAAASIPLGADREPLVADVAPARQPPPGLAAPAFSPLPLGAIRPAGWLARQLRLQADGLTGHLDEFWPDVAESQWFGGAAEGWERAPYWLDGAIPLAWALDDASMKGRIARHVNFILDHQRADGWYGPYPEDAAAKRYDLWAILLANKMLAQYHDATGDARVLAAVETVCAPWTPASRARRSTTGASSGGTKGSYRSTTCTRGRKHRGCSTSRVRFGARAWTSKPFSRMVIWRCRRLAAVCGNGRSTA
ncbi:MAG: hypothetical protein ACRD1V_19765 [Vicinamibacterales bacterium]